jgi:cytochrome c553
MAGCSEAPEPEAQDADIEAGKAFVKAHCTGCHTLDGQGKTSEIPNLAGQPVEYLVDALNAYRDGTRKHAALRGLIVGTSEADVRNMAAYFAGLPPVQAKPAAVADRSTVYAAGQEVAAACTACHGQGGHSTSPGIPSLAGQHPAYLIVSTQEYASGTRGHAEKEAMLENLDDVDIEKMAMYFAAQSQPQREAPPFGDVTAGEPLTAICGSCHGPRGASPDPMVPNLAGQEPTYLVNAIRAYRDRERSHEEMVADKSDAEIESIAAWYSVQRAEQNGFNSAGAEQVIAKCDRCHGPSAAESSMVVPNLTGQNQDYLLRVMKEYRDEMRGSSMMHKMSAGYSDALLAEIAEHYATRPNRQ